MSTKKRQKMVRDTIHQNN